MGCNQSLNLSELDKKKVKEQVDTCFNEAMNQNIDSNQLIADQTDHIQDIWDQGGFYDIRYGMKGNQQREWEALIRKEIKTKWINKVQEMIDEENKKDGHKAYHE
mmetsp:Transcript_39332/g.34832  ORF Transcript_39332/g.34832 Transcript_39332/m.34832 type:complete len:105 (-) Transcript_39332:38-352(-)